MIDPRGRAVGVVSLPACKVDGIILRGYGTLMLGSSGQTATPNGRDCIVPVLLITSLSSDSLTQGKHRRYTFLGLGKDSSLKGGTSQSW